MQFFYDNKKSKNNTNGIGLILVDRWIELALRKASCIHQRSHGTDVNADCLNLQIFTAGSTQYRHPLYIYILHACDLNSACQISNRSTKCKATVLQS